MDVSQNSYKPYANHKAAPNGECIHVRICGHQNPGRAKCRFDDFKPTIADLSLAVRAQRGGGKRFCGAMNYRALVIGASGGIGAALVVACAELGSEVARLSRRDEGFDLSDPVRASEMLRKLDGHFDKILVATGILAPDGARLTRALADIDAAAMAQVITVNATGPALDLREALGLIPREGRAMVGVLIAWVGSIGDNGRGGWYSHGAAKAAAMTGNFRAYSGALKHK